MRKLKRQAKKTDYVKFGIYFFIGLSVFIVSFILQAKIVFTILSHASNLVSQNYTTSKFQSASGGCPTTSSQSYDTLRVQSDYQRPSNVGQNPEINMNLRGYAEVPGDKQLVSYGGDTDPVMPPNLGTMFPVLPSIVKTYAVHQWDWSKNAPSPNLEQHWPVNLIGLSTYAGEQLVGPKAGRDIGGGHVLMLVYATSTSATFVHGLGDNPGDGYFIHMDNFCLDSNLYASYEKEDSNGRGSLPVIRTGQVFGYGNGGDFRVAIRDSGDWMDPRSRKDWWQGFGDLPTAPVVPPTQSVVQPTQPPGQLTQPVVQPTQSISQPPSNTPTPQVVATNPPVFTTPTLIVSRPVVSNPINQWPTPPVNNVVPSSSVTPVPPTPTPEKPLSQKIVESPVIRFIQSLPGLAVIFIHTILP
ncbi:hypothetical protein M1271_02460 [Patescibacteria group bacterium]|nr:hypothetical protein [Patescibacteria group bacterium]